MFKVISIAFLVFTLFRLIFPKKKSIGPKNSAHEVSENQDIIDIHYEEVD